MGRERVGRIEVITGAMFSGKTKEGLRRARIATIRRDHVIAFSPAINTRDGDEVRDRDGDFMSAIIVEKAAEIRDIFLAQETSPHVVLIEEAQFYDPEIVQVVNWLADCQKARVIITGLDLDFRRQPFGSMHELMAIADDVEKLTAVCMSCYEETGRYTQRIVNGEPASWYSPIVLVGDKESYEARCRGCYVMNDAPHGVIYGSLE